MIVSSKLKEGWEGALLIALLRLGSKRDLHLKGCYFVPEAQRVQDNLANTEQLMSEHITPEPELQCP